MCFQRDFFGLREKNFVQNDSPPSCDHGQRCHHFLSLKGSSPKRGLKMHFPCTDKDDCIKNIGDKVHLELNVLNGLEIGHKVLSHSLQTVGKQYMRNVRE